MSVSAPSSALPVMFVTQRELAKIFSLSLSTLDRLEREGLPVHRWGPGIRRYSPDEVRAWLIERAKRLETAGVRRRGRPRKTPCSTPSSVLGDLEGRQTPRDQRLPAPRQAARDADLAR